MRVYLVNLEHYRALRAFAPHGRPMHYCWIHLNPRAFLRVGRVVVGWSSLGRMWWVR